MSTTQPDITFMHRALELAAAGVGQVSPNPLVGCVIVSSDGKVVGEGTYTYDNVTHAEVLALEQAGEKARGGTAYVSLEPHHHHGRTAPCTEALIDARIARVVCPIEDPNPLVSGTGFERLREAGIEVTTGLLADEAARLNERFICWHRNRRPFVHLKLASSLDGRISLRRRISTALSSDEGLARVQELRHSYDAILVGGSTVLSDDPMLTDRSNKPRRRDLVRVILDNRLRIAPHSKLVQTAQIVPTLLFTNSEDASKLDDLRSAGVDVIVSPEGARDLNTVLYELGRRDLQSVLVEGGSEIAGSFIDYRLVDKITLLFAPIVLGGHEAPPAVTGHGADSVASALRLQDITLTPHGPDIEVTGYPFN